MKNNVIIHAVIPARSGSKGLPHKNIKLLNGKPLMAYTIEFANKLNLDKVICSTDSDQYADIATQYGAEVPFLRSDFASTSKSMEQDILKDMFNKFKKNNISLPNIIVWLRPTFVFRSLNHVKKCIDMLLNNNSLSAARTICLAESRLYSKTKNHIIPDFETYGKSMVRRQDIIDKYKVFSTDVFRCDGGMVNDNFLGDNVAGVTTSKICGLDIDDITDFYIVESLLKHKPEILYEYM